CICRSGTFRFTSSALPVLVKNSMLSFVVEQLKKTGPQAAPADHCYAGPEDVACDVCTGRRLKALKSCLQCLASYCKTHLEPHYNMPAFTKHRLVEASPKLEESICSRHQEIMKMYCRTDQQCICYLCSKDEHKGHNKVSAAAERHERESEIGDVRQKIQQRIQTKEKEMNLFQQEEHAINHSADSALRNAEGFLSELLRVAERRIADVKEKIMAQQKAEVGRFKNAQEKVEQEINDLRGKDTELKKLSLIEDHTHFLLAFFSLSCPTESKYPPSVNIRRLQYFEKVTVALVEAQDKLHEVLGEEHAKILMAVPEADVIPSNPKEEPKTRADFLYYACQITLDPNTANNHLALSKENRRVTFTREEQNYSYHPERFAFSWQVLSREGLTGRCYWEVERSGRGVLIAVAYKDIRRVGDFDECVFGHNEKSWALDCFKNSCEFSHYNIKTSIPGTWSTRVGVYLDHSAGILSFYSVSENMTLLRRVKTTFTQPLYAGLWLSDGATCGMLGITNMLLPASDLTGSCSSDTAIPVEITR
uniref:B30.2/SPRY domain-containing protein n=1 Tax=Mastacembelus armatus TaxID=205130 RepID=A0A7N8Y5I9_9TELE